LKGKRDNRVVLKQRCY